MLRIAAMARPSRSTCHAAEDEVLAEHRTSIPRHTLDNLTDLSEGILLDAPLLVTAEMGIAKTIQVPITTSTSTSSQQPIGFQCGGQCVPMPREELDR